MFFFNPLRAPQGTTTTTVELTDDGRTCLECGRQFFDAMTMRRHSQLHTGEMPFNCFYCDYKTNRKESLMSHCVKKHEMEPEEFKARARATFVAKPRGRPKRMPPPREDMM